jgi:hypothetical protein
MAVIPRPGFSTRFSKGRIGRGLRHGVPQPTFRFLPDWEHSTKEAAKAQPNASKIMDGVHDGMANAMHSISRDAPGGGWEKTNDGWRVGIGSPPVTHTHWHLLEFGGGRQYARGVVRRALNSMGKFEPVSRP